MLVVSLSRIVLLFIILIFITFLIDNGHCDWDDDDDYSRHAYPSEFRASHSPSYDYIYMSGDLLLGGFFPIHQPPSNEYNSNQCTIIKRERGIQRLEAMLFALDVVNSRSSYFNSSLYNKYQLLFGALIYDSCDYESYAIERAFNMLLPSLNQCRSSKLINQSSLVAGVIGSASSTVSMAIADILRLAEIPQISYASTSSELSQKPRFEYFSRVVPPDTYQAEAVVSIIVFLNWTYVAVIKETGSYGERLTDDFKSNLKNRTVCIAGELSVNIKDSNSYARVIRDLYDDEKYRSVVGVIVFAQEDSVRQILNQTTLRKEFNSRWVFLGTDGWGKKRYPVESFGRAAINAITITPKLYLISEFDHYFQNLIPSKNLRNPWFKEYWEETYKCKFPYTPRTIFNQNYTRLCSDSDSTHPNYSVPYFQEGYVHYVVDAVLALVISIQNLLEEKCTSSLDKKVLCQEFYPFDGTRLLTLLRNVSVHNELSKRLIRFASNGDGIGTYDIFQYQFTNTLDTSDYFKIGEFSDSHPNNERVRIDLKAVKWYKYNPDSSRWLEISSTPRSFCSETCQPGEIRTNTDSQQCCWTCRSCGYFHIAVNETACLPCSDREIPDLNFTKCIPIVKEYLSIRNIIAWPALIFSSTGLLMTLYTIVIFIRYAQTPIIKASSRELSYFLLFGMCCCHLCAWPLILKPHAVTCLLIRIGVGLSLTICLAALLTKTNRLARIFNNNQSLTQPSCLSPRSQLGICASIVSVQLIGVLVWILISPPEVKLKPEIKHNQRRLILVCQTDNEYLAYSLIYNMILVISCTLYAIKTRHIPENFNEAKHIGFAMYSVCIIWLAFIPIFFGLRSSDNWFRIQLASLAVCLSLSATVILLCLFAPKIYVVLFNPSKNIHVKFKTTLSMPLTSIEYASTSNNNLEELAAATAANRRRGPASADFTTEVSLYNSKSDSWGLNLTDELTQTGSISGASSFLNGACTDAERQQQQQHLYPQEDETTDLLSPSKQRMNSNCLQHSPMKSTLSNVPMSTENPWKKMSNVRYKLDEDDDEEQNPMHVHAQHITFV